MRESGSQMHSALLLDSKMNGLTVRLAASDQRGMAFTFGYTSSTSGFRIYMQITSEIRIVLISGRD
jgi:hypothetical protein